MKEIKKLYYKKGRRYYEYIKNREIPNNQLYYIENDELIPYDELTMEWYNYNGKPKQGIWRVHDSGYSWIGDYGMSDFRIKLENYRDVVLKSIQQALKNCDGKYISTNDIATEILNELSNNESELK